MDVYFDPVVFVRRGGSVATANQSRPILMRNVLHLNVRRSTRCDHERVNMYGSIAPLPRRSWCS